MHLFVVPGRAAGRPMGGQAIRCGQTPALAIGRPRRLTRRSPIRPYLC